MKQQIKLLTTKKTAKKASEISVMKLETSKKNSQASPIMTNK